MDCHVCGAHASEFAAAKIIKKYDIQYFRCGSCEFIQTETPYWLDEAYQNAIIDSDVGLIARNERFAQVTTRLLRYVYPQAKLCVDYGGGYGMFTRMLRDRGHDFRHLDPHCENLFAKGLEAQVGSEHFDLLTAFEVWEHLADPIADIDRMDAMADHWLVSTETVPAGAPKPGEWWYYALEGGQHISLWSTPALKAIAERYNRQYLRLHHGLHLFSRKQLNRRLTRWIVRKKIVAMFDMFGRREPLTVNDYHAAIRRAA